ncbi:MAG: hypothetical protein HQ538_05265 [Parcubacteria group bacterium]|nr:hypothetical protein [Parcubacteria group bacterium]
MFFLTITNVPYYIIDGRITKLYFLEDGQETRLAVWFTHTQDNNISEVHSNRLKSFNLQSGVKLNQLDLNKRYYFDDYGIYGPFDRYAWGYSEQTNTSLIDLFDLKIILDQDKISTLNPKLGSVFEPISNNFYTDQENSLTFYNAQGQFVKVLPDYSGESDSKEITKLDTQSFDQLEEKINVQQILNHEKAHIITSLEIDNEILVFVTIDDYTLSALRVDPETHDILGQIDYFK